MWFSSTSASLLTTVGSKSLSGSSKSIFSLTSTSTLSSVKILSEEDEELEVKENIDFDEPESEFEGTVISDDADVQENHMIEEIEVDEDEDLLDDMSYDDFDYSNDDNDDYEM